MGGDSVDNWSWSFSSGVIDVNDGSPRPVVEDVEDDDADGGGGGGGGYCPPLVGDAVAAAAVDDPPPPPTQVRVVPNRTGIIRSKPVNGCEPCNWVYSEI